MSFWPRPVLVTAAFAIVVASNAWRAEATPGLSLDDAFLASEALQEAPRTNASLPPPAVSLGVASSARPSPRPAPRKLTRDDLRALQAIASDAEIKLKIAAAWAASNPKRSDRAEHGFWICRDLDTGQLYTRPFDAADGPRRLIPGMPSLDAIAFFHTHPFPGVPQGPSAEDELFAEMTDMPGIVRSRQGLHYFGPGPKPWQPR